MLPHLKRQEGDWGPARSGQGGSRWAGGRRRPDCGAKCAKQGPSGRLSLVVSPITVAHHLYKSSRPLQDCWGRRATVLSSV